MIKRLPRFAETMLQNLCADAGALCQKVDEDESGWDFLVEFPPKSSPGPADTHPPSSSAYVQVKSTRGRLACRVKLSNALRAAHSPQPWFIVLAAARKRSTKVYAIHVWEGLIRRTLKAVRLAWNGKQPLNQRWLTIPFTSGDEKGSELVPWMQESIDAVKPEYDGAKRAINRTAGYEESRGTVLMTIEASTKEELMKNFLGLGDGLRVNRFSYAASRFGVISATPEVEASSGIVHITPHPAGDIEVRLRSHLSSKTIVLSGKLYASNFQEPRLRYSAGFLELLCGPSTGSECHVKIENHEKHDLATIEKFVTLNEWLTEGQTSLQVWSKGKRVMVGTLCGNGAKQGCDWKDLAAGVRLLRSIAGSASPDQIKLSLYDLGVADGLKTFSQVSQAESFRVQFEPKPDAPSQFTSILYWYHIGVGDHAFFALVEWTVVEDVLINGMRRVTANKHRFLEAYALTHPTKSDLKMMQRDYERHLASRTQTATLADLREFIAASAALRGPVP